MRIIESANLTMKLFWPMIILCLLTTLFFIGGWTLDFIAAEKGIKKLTQESGTLSSQVFQQYYDYQVKRTERVHEAAKSLYDIAKICLGALIGSLTQLISFVTQSARGATSDREGDES
jgi:hypothetical protein